jgi:hypothetical protein
MLDLLNLVMELHDKMDEFGADDPHAAPLDPKNPLPVEVESREKRLRALLDPTLENTSDAGLKTYIDEAGELKARCEVILRQRQLKAEDKLAETLAPEKHLQPAAPEETPA